MSEVAPLISDLAVILIAAGAVTLLFKWLKQPVILGYIVAGILAGPATSFLPTVTDVTNIKTWADIGVIFLLFAMGLDFSFKKLMNVGFTAFIAAIVIICGMMVTGYMAGNAMGFSHMNSLFLGGMLSMSSTAIVFKAFNDMGLMEQKFTGVVLGILVVEDLLAVVMMVVLSTLAASQHFEGSAMMDSILKLVVFLVFWFALGIFLIPTLMKKARKLVSDEILLIVAIGLCLGMVMIATKAGFSSALGAFVMGSLLAETVVSDKIRQVFQPVKDLFGAIFFVSVGMMIDPAMIWQYGLPILLLTVLVLAGQSCFGTFGVLLSGQPLKIAIQSGFSLTQVGEFAFIIASLGMSLKVTDDYLYPVIVAVSVITTFLTPYMMRAAEPAYQFLDKHLPASLKQYMAHYSSGAVTPRLENTWYKLLKSMLLSVGVYAVICLFCITMFFTYIQPVLDERIPGIGGRLAGFAILFVIVAPFLWAIIMKKNHSPEFQKLWTDSMFNRGLLVSVVLVKVMVCIVLIMGMLVHLFNVASGAGLIGAIVVIGLIYFSKHVRKRSLFIENQFLQNLQGEPDAEEEEARRTALLGNDSPFKELHTADFVIAPESVYAGKTLMETDIRKHFQVNVIQIRRGEICIEVPEGKERIYPSDRITVVGTDEQLYAFRTALAEKRTAETPPTKNEEMRIRPVEVEAGSPLIGRSLRQIALRNCIIIGLERAGESLMNPNPDTQIKENDTLWMVGKKSALKQVAMPA